MRPRLRPLASFCKTDPSLWVADALRSASGPGRDPNDRQVSVIETQVSRVFEGTRDNGPLYAFDVSGGGRSSAIGRRMSAKRVLAMGRVAEGNFTPPPSRNRT